MNKIRIPMLVFASLAGLNFILFKFYSLSFPIHIDPVDYTHPMLSLLKNYLLKGETPFWSPQIFGGSSLLFAGSYDLKALPLLFFFETFDSIVLLGSILIFLSGFFFYLMARINFNFSSTSSFVGAIFWSLNPFQLMYIYDHVFMTIFLWVPIIILCLHKFRLNPFLSIFLISIAITDQLFTGRVQSLEFMVFIILFYIFSLPYIESKSFKKNLSRNILILAASSCLALLILSPFLSDFIRQFMDSSRTGSKIGTAAQKLWQVNFLQVIPFPLSRGDWVTYLGPIGFFPLFISLAARKFLEKSENRRNIVFSLFSILSLYFYYNYDSCFDLYYKELPFHNGIRYTLRLAPVTYFFILFPIMSGIKIIEDKKYHSLIVKFLIHLAGMSSLVLAILAFNQSDISLNPFTIISCILIFQTLVFGLIFFVGAKSKIISSLIIIACLINILSPTLLWRWPTNPVHLYQSTYKNNEFITIEEEISKYNEEKYSFRFLSDTLPIYGFEGPSIWSFLLSEGYHNLVGYSVFSNGDRNKYLQDILKGSIGTQFHHDHHIDPPVNAWRLNNVKYFIAKGGRGYSNKLLHDPRVTKVFTSERRAFEVFALNNTLPRFYFANEFKLASRDDVHIKINEQLKEDYHWFQGGIVLEDEKLFEKLNTTKIDQSSTTFKVDSYKSNEINISTSAKENSVFVALETFDPWRWKVEIDGVESSYVRANSIYRALYIPKGFHKIRFYYKLPTFAYILSGFGFLILLVLGMKALRYRKK